MTFRPNRPSGAGRTRAGIGDSTATSDVVDTEGFCPRLGRHAYERSSKATSSVDIAAHRVTGATFIRLRNAALDRSRVVLRQGGDEFGDMPASEKDEFAEFLPGTLLVSGEAPRLPEGASPYQKRLLASAVPARSVLTGAPRTGQRRTTIAIERHEYVNFYHTMMELFCAYASSSLFDVKPFDLLLLDGHPRGDLDALWSEILRPAELHRLHDYAGEIIEFDDLILAPGGHQSPLHEPGPVQYRPSENLLTDFVELVLTSSAPAGIALEPDLVVFIDRRDYRPHPRSDGVTDRKVENIDEVVSLLTATYPGYRVEVHSFEGLSLTEQLAVVRRAAVLSGVHGAALTHVLFMHQEAELVEFAPIAWAGYDLFKDLAGARGIKYSRFYARTTQTLASGKIVVQPTNQRIAW